VKTTIEIQNLRIHAFHGVLPQEHTVGNLYEINCILTTDFQAALESDDLNDTISYAEVVEIIEKEMRTPSKLLEHVGGRICKSLRMQYGDKLQSTDLRIAKLSPPICADIQACAIHIIDGM